VALFSRFFRFVALFFVNDEPPIVEILSIIYSSFSTNQMAVEMEGCQIRR
jgi:hypothetical protein